MELSCPEEGLQKSMQGVPALGPVLLRQTPASCWFSPQNTGTEGSTQAFH